jgi:glycerol-3-phosphate acyltransferase PlsY
MLWIITGILSSYLLGSIPTAYLFGRLRGIDIRQHGSGNIGATNALRVLGRASGIIVLLLDIFKGFTAVFFLGNFFVSRVNLVSSELLFIILGLTCIAGHNWTIFLKFKGGKGVATTLGVLLGLSFQIKGLGIVLLLVIITWLVIFVLFRIVSLASIIAGLSIPIYIFILKLSLNTYLLGILLSLFIFIRHRTNLKRLIEGKESRLSFRQP